MWTAKRCLFRLFISGWKRQADDHAAHTIKMCYISSFHLPPNDNCLIVTALKNDYIFFTFQDILRRLDQWQTFCLSISLFENQVMIFCGCFEKKILTGQSMQFPIIHATLWTSSYLSDCPAEKNKTQIKIAVYAW